jgi:hypothetical protein
MSDNAPLTVSLGMFVADCTLSRDGESCQTRPPEKATVGLTTNRPLF